LSHPTGSEILEAWVTGDIDGELMPRTLVHVLTFEGCPHAAEALGAAREAARSHHPSVAVIEVDLLDPGLPEAFRGYPSPTVLVDMTEVLPSERSTKGPTCHAAGAPSTEAVRLAIRAVLERA
jgi:hypothetical protein